MTGLCGLSLSTSPSTHSSSPLRFLGGINLLRIGSGFCFPLRCVDGVSGSHRLAVAPLMTGPRAESVTWGPCP